MKILEICNFSSGVSGVWTRVLEDAKEFIKRGHEVYVFSSNENKGEESIAKSEETLEGVRIKRFPVKRKQGYALWFDFKKDALDLKPDIIICHGLRKPYLRSAIKVAKKIGAKIFLVTHAPFLDKELRSKKLNFLILLYDKFYGKRILNSFDRVISICKWEYPFLLKLGCDKERIGYIPNSIPDEFFETENREGRGIYFMGGISSIKNLEILDLALSKLNRTANAIGPIDKGYNPNFENIKIKSPIYDLKEKIEEIDKYEIFVLPSKREAFPFGLLEAMSRGKIVITTKTNGGVELVDHLSNGFLFNIGDSIGLELLLFSMSKLTNEQKLKIKDAARQKAKEFRLSKTMKWEELFRK